MPERNTQQKQTVLRALCEMRSHPTAEEVYEYVRTRAPQISRATVYRTLRCYSESGRILRVSNSLGADHYDHNTHPHYHVCCTGCGRVADVAMPDPGDLTAHAAASEGFVLTGCSVEFTGLCPACAAKAAPSGPNQAQTPA